MCRYMRTFRVSRLLTRIVWIYIIFYMRHPDKNIYIFKRHLQSFADLWPTLMGFSIYI